MDTLNTLVATAHKLCGVKQVLKGIKDGEVSKVILATDADNAYKSKVLRQAEIFLVPVEEISTSAHLATLCNLEVPTAVVGLLK